MEALLPEHEREPASRPKPKATTPYHFRASEPLAQRFVLACDRLELGYSAVLREAVSFVLTVTEGRSDLDGPALHAFLRESLREVDEFVEARAPRQPSPTIAPRRRAKDSVPPTRSPRRK